MKDLRLSKTPSDTFEGVFKYYFFSLITNKTPVRIRIEPIQNGTPMFSPKISHPSNVPTTGWKKKNIPPLEALSICNPRFQSRNPHAVETIPKYKSPPQIVG